MRVVMATGAIRHAKLQSKCHYQQTNNPVFLQARCPSCRQTNNVKALSPVKILPELLWTEKSPFNFGSHPDMGSFE